MSEGPTRKIEPEVMGAAGMSLVCAAVLAWAVWGSPPYAFFGVMKWAVAATCAYWAALLWLRSKALAPVSLLLLVAGGLHAFGEMRRDEWVPINLVTMAMLLLSALGMTWPGISRRIRWAIAVSGAAILVMTSLSALAKGVLWAWDPRFWR